MIFGDGKTPGADACRECRRADRGLGTRSRCRLTSPTSLLVDYHFGFTKRALIGATVSLLTAKVPMWLVFALAGTVWLVTAGLFASYSGGRSV